MALVDIAARARLGPGHKECAVCYALDTIPASEADGLRDLMRNAAKRFTEISEEIADDPDTPLNIDAYTLGRHARGDCSANEILRPKRRRR